jgi:ubiquinone/menaquinone biosynthesis C-methylase UbiE
MHVLDLGTGRGDVAFIAGEIVGPSGRVVGIDSAPTTVAIAQERTAAESCGNVSFEQGDPIAFKATSTLDAVIGRYVLQFLPDPAAALRQLGLNCVPAGSSLSTRSIGQGTVRFRQRRSGIDAACSSPRP